MDIQYRRNTTNNYVVLKEDNLLLKDYKLNMVLKNDIPGILKVYASCVDGQTELSYIISSKESIKDLYEKNKMSFDEILNVLKAIIKVCCTAQNYLLKAEDILLEPELIFYDYGSKDISFCYYPNSNRDLRYELRNLIEKIMIITEHKDRKGVEFIYGVFSICNKREFLIRDIEDYIKEFEKIHSNGSLRYEDLNQKYIENPFSGDKDIDDEHGEWQYANFRYDDFSEKDEKSFVDVVCEKPNDIYNDDIYASQDMKSLVKNNIIIKKIADVFSSKNKKLTSNNKDEKGPKETFQSTKESKSEDKFRLFMSKDYHNCNKDNYNCNNNNYSNYDNAYENNCEDFNDNTMYINQLNHGIHGNTRTLFSLSEQKNIDINTNPFIIGKLSSRVDFVIEDNTVSRIHLKIINENDEYYIEDMNSKNGTYLNGIQTEPHEKVKIETGDKIRIAGYEYVFR